MKISVGRLAFAAIALVGIGVSALGTVHAANAADAYATARGTATAAFGAPRAIDEIGELDIAKRMPSQPIDEGALGKDSLEVATGLYDFVYRHGKIFGLHFTDSIAPPGVEAPPGLYQAHDPNRPASPCLPPRFGRRVP